jgi:peptidoglycan/xylan/chitin deacetylase (PgdA/CDA1 family)
MLAVNAGESQRPGVGPALAGYSLAALLLPALAAIGDAPSGVAWAAPAAVLIAAGAATLVDSRIPPPTFTWLGGLLTFVAAWLIPQTGQTWVICLLGLIIGMGFGLAAPRPSELRNRWAGAFLAIGVLQLGLLALVAHDDAAPIGGAAYGLALLGLGLTRRRPRPRPRLAARVLAVDAVVLTALTTCWIGGNERTVTWFGRLVNHGPRQERQVAITFDDGPNAGATLALSAILDRNHVKGTFFTVGKALDARPDISKALIADGQLLGNHSYVHDSVRWLDPGYPELARTQKVLKRRVGACPAFFRPPHGQHTPFMADVVKDRGMTMVGWDAAGGDWATRDPGLVARRILGKVRPGSIILLHDGLDGDVTSDRTVVVRALPLILDGLKSRHLKPVRLDRLLHKPGYGEDHC